jgi:hypothetical protein
LSWCGFTACQDLLLGLWLLLLHLLLLIHLLLLLLLDLLLQLRILTQKNGLSLGCEEAISEDIIEVESGGRATSLYGLGGVG